MKNTQEFTAFALETWCATLSVFEPTIVTRAVLEIGLGADPFPDLGKVVMRCEEMRRVKASTVPTDGKCKLSEGTIAKAAQALGLVI
jgi:hypothetical protein